MQTLCPHAGAMAVLFAVGAHALFVGAAMDIRCGPRLEHGSYEWGDCMHHKHRMASRSRTRSLLETLRGEGRVALAFPRNGDLRAGLPCCAVGGSCAGSLARAGTSDCGVRSGASLSLPCLPRAGGAGPLGWGWACVSGL